MKEIKFKAWHKAEEIMCDVSIINFDQGAFLIGVKPGEDEIGDKYFIPAPANGRFCTFDEIELLQYTGLKDENGEGVYEGDILTFISKSKYGFCEECRKFIGPVEFGEFNPLNDTLYDFIGFHIDNCSVEFRLRHGCEIISNIYENPELLI